MLLHALIYSGPTAALRGFAGTGAPSGPTSPSLFSSKQGKKKLSFFTNKSSRCRFPQQLLALPFLRSCLLPESIGKERRGKSIVTRENDLGLSRNLLCIMRPHQVPVPSYILLTWLKLNLWQEICLPASKNPAHMMHNLVKISVNSSKAALQQRCSLPSKQLGHGQMREV